MPRHLYYSQVRRKVAEGDRKRLLVVVKGGDPYAPCHLYYSQVRHKFAEGDRIDARWAGRVDFSPISSDDVCRIRMMCCVNTKPKQKSPRRRARWARRVLTLLVEKMPMPPRHTPPKYVSGPPPITERGSPRDGWQI